ncbi:MAG: hypothetical protein CMI31_05965 [Opitutae bacterium]|nr:hypothetical protein [Opitutae bacterium]
MLYALFPVVLGGMGLTGKDTDRQATRRIDFDAHPEGPYEMRVFRRDWANASLGQFHKRAAITAEPTGKSLRLTFPKGSLGPNKGGGHFSERLAPQKAYRLSYRLLFEKGFDFRRGGKLPGLAGGKANTGGKKPTGDGWSARYMWGEGGKLDLYLYHLDQRTQYGDRFPLQAKATHGKWLTLSQVVQVNTPGKADGRIQVWLNEKLALDQKGLRLRGKVEPEVALVDKFLFSTFHGGSTRKWAPVRDCHARFDDFHLAPSP